MDSITTCEVCYVNFDTNDRAPRVLPCGHTFCTKCLTNILNNPTLRRCPTGNDAFPPSQNSVASFPLNFAILKMLEQKKSNACKAHPEERLKFICLTDQRKICSECAKHEDHKDHNIKKMKTLKAQGAKVKEDLQQCLLKIKEHEQKKDQDCEQTKKVFIRTITEQFKEIKEILVEKEFEFVQQANALFDADKINDSQGIFVWKQQIDETIKDITHACQDESGDMMILDKEVTKNGQILVNSRIQFLKEKFARVHQHVLKMQNSLKEAIVNSKNALSSLQLSSQELVKQIYSAQEASEQLSQEELIRKQRSFRCVKFPSHFDVSRSAGCLQINTTSPQLQEVEINLDDLQAVEKINIHLTRYDTLRKDPVPSVLSYIFHGLKNPAGLKVTLESLGFTNESFLWLGDTIQNHIQNFKKIVMNFLGCKLNDDSMRILCEKIFYQAISLKCFCLFLDSCFVKDADLETLAKALKPLYKNLTYFGIGLNNNPELTSRGADEIFKLIQSMNALKELRLDLRGLKLSNQSWKTLGESVLPTLQSLGALCLWLNGSAISDESIYIILKNLPNLKGLNINLSQTPLTDSTLEMFIEKVIPRLKALESLSFRFEGVEINENNLVKIQKVVEMINSKKN